MEGMVDGIVAVSPGKFFKSLRNHTSHQVGGLFGGNLVIGLITGDSGVCTRCMRRYDSLWLVCSVRLVDDLTAGRRLYAMTAWW